MLSRLGLDWNMFASSRWHVDSTNHTNIGKAKCIVNPNAATLLDATLQFSPAGLPQFTAQHVSSPLFRATSSYFPCEGFANAVGCVFERNGPCTG